MLKGKIIDKALSTTESIETDRSRCLRMRFNRNECNRCIEQCRSEAIEISHDVSISSDKCSECMLCVSSCPSDCFEIKGHDFYSVIGRLRKIQSSVRSPILGCRVKTNPNAHERTHCFGFLSEEHIIAFSVFMQKPLQIDMTGCADCRNGFIVNVLEKGVDSVETKTSIKISEKIKLVQNKTDLDFQEISYDRRDFFRKMKKITVQKTADLFDNVTVNENLTAYSHKKLPFKRELLNRTLSVFSNETQKELFKNYYYSVNIDESCNYCFACIGMCPTGALKIETIEDGRELFVSSALCNGCGLCESFCIKKSVRIERGFTGGSPFEFQNAKMESLCEV